MAIELHHLHPGHDDDLSRLKARIAELEKENQTLAEDVSDKIESITELMELVEKYKSEKAELEEERRWRKFPDEKPSEEGYYIICGSSGFRNADKWTYCKDRQKMDFSFYSYGVKYWMPMPSAPKEEK